MFIPTERPFVTGFELIAIILAWYMVVNYDSLGWFLILGIPKAVETGLLIYKINKDI